MLQRLRKVVTHAGESSEVLINAAKGSEITIFDCRGHRELIIIFRLAQLPVHVVERREPVVSPTYTTGILMPLCDREGKFEVLHR